MVSKQILEMHLTDIGISLEVAEILEEQRGVIKVLDLLRLTQQQLRDTKKIGDIRANSVLSKVKAAMRQSSRAKPVPYDEIYYV